MPKKPIQTEDVVRTQAAQILGLGEYNDPDDDAQSDVGQLTTFNQLGFKCEGTDHLHKPDGWYLPRNPQDVAIILETKSSDKVLSYKEWEEELLNNVRIIGSAKNISYPKVVGILYNGNDVRVFKNDKDVTDEVADTLQHHSYYTRLFDVQAIDKNRIYGLTKRINDLLKSEFGIKDLTHRMIFTACALVAKRYNAMFVPGMDYSFFHNSIHNTLAKELINSKQQNQKLGLLLDVFSEIKMNLNVNDEDEKQQQHVKDLIGDFIGWVGEISECLNSNEWRGEDVMGIFFNEFSRYKGKSEQGQVFTPEHITNFMYRILGVDKSDKVLDAACGSGGFLVKAMANMIREAGGEDTQEAKEIKSNQLFGIEFDREVYALACANMLLHKDGKTNLEQMDSRTENACEWIREQGITKVMMNPPFEDKFGCMDIVLNVLDNVPKGTKCGFILPDRKLATCSKKALAHLKKNHCLETIIKLPEKLFVNVNTATSLFVFEAGRPQGDDEVFACYMEDDGLARVKNEGRHDIYGKWNEIEDYWVSVYKKRQDDRYETGTWLDPDKDELCYPVKNEAESLARSDFYATAQQYIYFADDVNEDEFKGNLMAAIMETDVGNIKRDGGRLNITVYDIGDYDGVTEDIEWKNFALSDIFGEPLRGKRLKKTDRTEGNICLLTAGKEHQGYAQSIGNMDMPMFEDALTIDMFGNCFWHNGPFTADDNILVLNHNKLNENIGLFIASVINAKHRQDMYSYDKQYRQKTYNRDNVSFPVDADGEPDWDYMDSFMNKILEAERARISLLAG